MANEIMEVRSKAEFIIQQGTAKKPDVDIGKAEAVDLARPILSCLPKLEMLEDRAREQDRNEITRRSYNEETASLAREALREAIVDNEDGDLDAWREDAQERLRETADGHQWIIYNRFHTQILEYTGNEDAAAEIGGLDEALKKGGVSQVLQILAYCAFEADAMADLHNQAEKLDGLREAIDSLLADYFRDFWSKDEVKNSPEALPAPWVAQLAAAAEIDAEEDLGKNTPGGELLKICYQAAREAAIEDAEDGTLAVQRSRPGLAPCVYMGPSKHMGPWKRQGPWSHPDPGRA